MIAKIIQDAMPRPFYILRFVFNVYAWGGGAGGLSYQTIIIKRGKNEGWIIHIPPVQVISFDS